MNKKKNKDYHCRYYNAYLNYMFQKKTFIIQRLYIQSRKKNKYLKLPYDGKRPRKCDILINYSATFGLPQQLHKYIIQESINVFLSVLLPRKKEALKYPLRFVSIDLLSTNQFITQIT